MERFRAKATKARQAQSRLKALERMERIAPAHVDSPFHFRFRPPRRNPHPLLRLERTTAGYDGVPILDGVTLALSPGDRIGLLGPNGAGKSTLIKLLAGELPPGAGRRETAQDLNIGYFAQHQLDQLHPGHSAIAHLRQIDSAASEQSLRDYLGGFGFTGERAASPVAPFSGGEKARLVLALLVYQRPNPLLLDEPTNHLDLEMRHALSQALQEFEVAMVVVSHDRHLLRTTSDRLLLVSGGAVDEFRGDLDDYPRWLAENRAEARAPQSDEGDKHHSAAAKQERKRLEAQRRGQLQPLRQAVERLDRRLEQLGQRRLEVEQALAAPELYEAASKERLKALLGDKAELDRALEQTETQWFDACEALETAQQALE